ncbi:translation elongation factor Ts [Prochlorococcus marinus]|uniref:translation elongation factor Ts n=1 Tax=Prochlorococcus marinus TaxID=1219 RepID=UPI0022B4067C|nr:translation elongation factor Ts [Prochlorococcus marinus]
MAEITAKIVKQLRDKTSAGMMDCKKALIENKGDMEKSIEWLRQKGIASAEKKSGRVAAEGAVGSYIHTGSRVGVLLELNCETDFVARGDLFQGLLRDLSMQVAACPSVEYVSVDQIPESIANKEKEIEMGRDDLSGKPDQIKAKIVEGRIGKRLKEMALLEQPFIKDSSINVEELVKQVAGKIGENVKVRRFTRYTLGEGIEVQGSDFAEEVASMTSS